LFFSTLKRAITSTNAVLIGPAICPVSPPPQVREEGRPAPRGVLLALPPRRRLQAGVRVRLPRPGEEVGVELLALLLAEVARERVVRQVEQARRR
jgi:hypothetical protein